MSPFQLKDHPLYPGELVREARALIPLLRELEIGQGAVLAVQSEAPACWMWVWALARAADRAFMPLSPQLTGSPLTKALNNAGEYALLNIGDDGKPELSLSAPTPFPDRVNPPSPQSIRLIIHTSGSEGEARGVMHTAAGVEAASRAACQRLAFGRQDLWLVCLAPWHIGGIAILERALQQQARVLVMPRFDAGTVWSNLQRHPVTHISLVPAMLARLLGVACGRPPPSHLRKVLIGGGALPQPLLLKALDSGWPLCVSYGLTEAGSQAATLCTPGRHWHPGDAGLPLAGMEIRVRSGAGQYGPVMLRGPMLMAGYLNAALQPGDGLSEDGWFQSSDLGMKDDSGHLHVLGRNDDMIISGGVNVHPSPVEKMLYRHPDIQEAAVIGVPDPVFGEIVMAVVVGTISSEGLLAWCGERLPRPHRPLRVIHLQSMPLQSTGKIDRQRLRDLARISHQDGEPPLDL